MSIYIIEAVRLKLFKIGFSSNCKGRLKTFQTGSPVQLHLIGEWPGDGKTERAIHLELCRYRRKDEWFTVSLEMIAGAVSSHCKAEYETVLESLKAASRQGWAKSDRKYLNSQKKFIPTPDLPTIEGITWEKDRSGGVEAWLSPHPRAPRKQRTYLKRIGKRLLQQWQSLSDEKREQAVVEWVSLARMCPPKQKQNQGHQRDGLQ